VVYFAPNTGFLKVFEAAINDQERNPSVISIGWGGTEDTTQLEVEAINKLLQTASSKGITVCAASGDTGATDGRSDGKPHVDFPASSPWVLAVGGTHLLAAGGLIGSEVAWNSMQASVGGATGGGVSTIFPLPDWQKNAKVPLNPNGNAGRGLPDVAANADPTTGYQVYVDGQEMLIGGTSMSTPLWAGLIALLNQGLGRNIGFLNPVLYQKLGPAGILRSITQGNNRVANVGYSAGPGWNPVTGWGSPDGRKLLEALRSPQPPAPRKVRGVSAQ
jgi:kumamolisin